LHHFVSDNHHQLKADYYIFGHRHLPLKFQIQNALYFNLGEWINYQTFGRFDGDNFELLAWKNKTISLYKTISE
jgi:UDP-2,3-diacylglucosamine pyrophosphatase LpxH